MRTDINNFSISAAMEIIKGLSTQTMDQVKIYTDPKYSAEQMEQIRLGIDEGINVDIYTDPKYSAEQMEQIRLGILENVDAVRYAVEYIDADSMEIIRLAMQTISPDKVDTIFNFGIVGTGEDVDFWLTPSQLMEVYYGLIENLDVGVYSNYEDGYTADQMRVIREAMIEKWDVKYILNPQYGPKTMKEIKDCMQFGFDIIDAVNYIISRIVKKSETQLHITRIGDFIYQFDALICCVINDIIYELLIEDIGQVIDTTAFKDRMHRQSRVNSMVYLGESPEFIDFLKVGVRELIKRI